MRTLLKLCAVATILAIATTPARPQGVLDRIKKKAEDAATHEAEKKVDRKIDEMSRKMVDNSFDAMFGDPSSGPKGGAGAGNARFTMGSNAKTEDIYTFNVVTTMEIESSKSTGKSDKAVLMMHFNTHEPYMGTSIISADTRKQDGTAFVVLDAKNQVMVMLMASEKSKFSIAYDWKEAQKYASANAPKDQVNWDTVKVWRNYSRIGTKTISGYSADGYQTESPDATVEIWVSRDPRLSVGNMFAANSGLKQMKGRLPADYPQGMLLQMVSVNKRSGEKVTMTVTNIDTNAHVTCVMADYPKMDMGKK